MTLRHIPTATSPSSLSGDIKSTSAQALPDTDTGPSESPDAFPANHQFHSPGISPIAASPPTISGETTTIGYLGDFAALLQLSLSVHNAFSEAAGASDDIRAATACLDSFRLAIEEIEASLYKAEDVPVFVENGVTCAVASCTTALKRVEARIELFRRRVGNVHGGLAWRGYWAACAVVVLGGKAEIVGLLQQLDDQVVALRTFLGLLQSTTLHELTNRPDIVRADISRVVACIGSLAARVRSHVPFQFFDHKECAVEPLLKMSWGNFLDFWTEHDFPIDAAYLSHGELFTAQYAEPSPGGLVYFNLYIYADPQSFGTPTALISPVYFYLKPKATPQRSYALSRLFLSSATWLAKTLDNPISGRAPLIGPRSRQQFLHLETGFPDDIRGSLHTRQYFLDTAPGPTQPEGRPSKVFAYLSEAHDFAQEEVRAAEMLDITSSEWELLLDDEDFVRTAPLVQ